MKKLITLIALLIVTLTSFARNYYISNTGNDGAVTNSISTPWATIAKVNSSMGVFVAGDSILFQCGGTFTGTLTVTTSGIILGSYDTGNKPEITGFYTIPSVAWASSGTNLWTASVPMTGNDFSTINFSNRDSRVYRSNSLTIDGRLVRKGRYPNITATNEGWLAYSSLPSGYPTTVLTSSSTLPTSFVDGDVVVRKVPWVMDVVTIAAQSGNNITINNVVNGTYSGGRAGLGFFIQNHPSTLDANDEWYFNNTNKTLTIYNTVSPASRVVRVPTINTIINLGSTSSVTIDNLDIKGAGNYGIVGSGSNIKIKNSIVRNISYWGIYLSGSNAIVDSCLIRDIASNGVWLNGSNSLLSNSQVKACGIIEGAGGSSDYEYEGINISNSGTIRNNIVDSVGYHGIHFDAPNIIIRENVVKNAVLYKSDGGAIYTWDQNGTATRLGRQIKRNIVTNIGRLHYGAGSIEAAAFGIYLDGGGNNVLVDSNVVIYNNVSQNANNTSLAYENLNAFLLNNPVNHTFTNNITFGWPCALAVSDWYGIVTNPPTPITAKPRGNNIQNNCFYVNSITGSNWRQANRSFDYRTQIGQALSQTVTDIQNMGVMNNNFIPNVQSPFHWTNAANDGPFPGTLASWRSTTGKDLNSQLVSTTSPEFRFNETADTITYDFNGRQKTDYKGNTYNNSAKIPPYYANIFFDNGTTTPVPVGYYISNSGDDTKDGRTPATAWRTITKLNNSWAIINPGDNIFFERGGTFTGTITPTKSGTATSRITIGAYGTGANPIITGFTTATGWTLTATPNVYVATVPTTTDINVLTVNGRLTAMGRFPNATAANEGWLTFSNLTATSLTSATTLTTNWTGATAVFRNRAYVISNSTITSQVGNVLNITPYDVGQEWSSGAGFFIQKDIRTLDADKEWFFNNSTDQLSMYSLTNPSSLSIRVATTDRLININGQTYLTIDGLSFEGSHGEMVYGSGVSNITVQNCNFQYTNLKAIHFTNQCSNILIKKCNIRDSWTDGIRLDNRGTIDSCALRNIGNVPGMMASGGDSKGRSICIESLGAPTTSNMTCTNNIIDSAGLIGVYFGGSNILVQNNFITNVGLLKNDGGSIYAYAPGEAPSPYTPFLTNRIVRKNIVLNNTKLLYGLPASYQNDDVRGIYMDGSTVNVLIDSNIVGNIRGEGIFGNNSVGLTIRDNVVYNTTTGILMNFLSCTEPLVRNNRITRNAIYTFTAAQVSATGNPATNIYFPNPDGIIGPAQQTMSYYRNDMPAGTNVYTEWSLIGYVDSNYIRSPGSYHGYAHAGGCYTNPYLDSTIDLTAYRIRTRSATYPNGFEANTTFTPTPNPTNAVPELVYNSTGTDLTVTFSGLSKKDYKGVVYNNSITLKAFTGTVLFANGSTSGIVVTASANPATIACFGGTTTVTVTATGGTSPYSGTGTYSRTAGTYTFTVTDAATPTPNSGSTTITLTQPAAALTVVLTPTNVTCFGSANGTITTSATGGTSPYTYNWGGGNVSPNRASLAPGSYNLTVTDSRLCATSTGTSITQPTQLFMGVPSAGKITSIGGTTTVTVVPASGGTAPYTYSINGGTTYQASTTFTGVAAGSRTVIARDFNLCTTSKTIVITQPNQPLIINRPIRNVTFLNGRTFSERLSRNLVSNKKTRYRPKFNFQCEEEESILDVVDISGSTLDRQTVRLNLKDNVFILRTSDLTTDAPSVNFRIINNTIINKILKP
jgi:hypothetical protein